jgi:glycosyltransferase involved in cell wall biosynthesis
MSNDFGLVSIIIPAYNAERYISDSLQSVLRQTYENWEAVVVDDCSTDNTCKIIQKYIMLDSLNRIRLIQNEKNLGVVGARNVAISSARGKYIAFLDSAFKQKHPEMHIEKKSDSPEEDKSISDSKSLKPVLADFFNLHPDFKPLTFLGDSIFDTCDTYTMLLNEFKFQRALIPLNSRNSNPNLPPIKYNDDGWPLCSKDPSVPMKPNGWSREEGRIDRFKWRCPQAKYIKGKWITTCDNPCNGKPCGRVTFTSPSMDKRMYPGEIRGSDEWISDYKIRVVVEKNIQYLKEPMACGSLKTRDNLTIKADLYLAGITQLLTLILADKIHEHKYIRSLKSLIA